MREKLLRVIAVLFLAFCLVIAVLLFALSSWNSSKSKQWLAHPDLSGEMVDIGGLKLFCRVTGAGKPIVIFEGDAGSSSAEWRHIQDALPDGCTKLIYDRAGYGWSDIGIYPRTPERVASELGSLLEAKGLSGGPFVLVGQGLGAFYLQLFASKYKSKIKAMIFSEPYSASYYIFKKEMDPVVYKNLLDRAPAMKMAGFMSSLGIVRYFNAVPYKGLPADLRNPVVENYSQKKTFAAMLSEYKNAPLRESDAPPPVLPRVPITVIHHSVENYRKELTSFYLSYNDLERIEVLWMNMLRTITDQSPRSRIIFAKNSTGNINIEEPDIIIDAVSRAVK
ncbi:MAG: alpha/beta hydrolase [Leptospirales bacterium]|nr:alpha/beta hydrolase [Leptospirales bacterium]